MTDSVVAVVPSTEMDIDYLELFLRSRRHFLETQAATQTAQKNINLQVLRPLMIPCPPHEIQTTVAKQILEPLTATKSILHHIAFLKKILASFVDQLIVVPS